MYQKYFAHKAGEHKFDLKEVNIYHWRNNQKFFLYSCKGITKCLMEPKERRSLETEKALSHLDREMCRKVV